MIKVKENKKRNKSIDTRDYRKKTIDKFLEERGGIKIETLEKYRKLGPNTVVAFPSASTLGVYAVKKLNCEVDVWNNKIRFYPQNLEMAVELSCRPYTITETIKENNRNAMVGKILEAYIVDINNFQDLPKVPNRRFKYINP